MLKSVSITIAQPTRLDRAVQSITGLPRAQIRGLLDHKCARVNGEVNDIAQSQLETGDVVVVRYDPHTRYREIVKHTPDPAYSILFEDEHVLVVNKAAHVLTVPTESGKGKTLIDALHRYVNRDRSPSARQRRLHVVHRLDLGVSGALVVAKSPEAATRIKDQFANRKPERMYIAIVNGILEPKEGSFRSHLATDGTLNRYSTRKPGAGQLAVTHYEALGFAHGATIVRVKLETGRRNQIRVHFAEFGHPVLGDPRYPREGAIAPPKRSRKASRFDKPCKPMLDSQHPKWKARRLALHAQTLEFEHPHTFKSIRFEAEVPTEFKVFMNAMRTS